MPEEDMPLFKTLYSNEKEGTVYITPNGSLKVCNTEGYKTIKDKELNNRQKLWPIQKNRWCVVSIIVDLTDQEGAKLKGYIDGIKVLESK